MGVPKVVTMDTLKAITTDVLKAVTMDTSKVVTMDTSKVVTMDTSKAVTMDVLKAATMAATSMINMVLVARNHIIQDILPHLQQGENTWILATIAILQPHIIHPNPTGFHCTTTTGIMEIWPLNTLIPVSPPWNHHITHRLLRHTAKGTRMLPCLAV